MGRFRKWQAWGLVFWLVSGVALAGDCGPYRVGVKEYPGVYERVPGGKGYQGLDKDFYALLAERSGCRFELVLESQPRIWTGIRNGRLDITGWALPTAERQTYVSMIPLLSARNVALTWATQGLQDEADFLSRPALRAVAVRGASYGAEQDALLQRLREQGRLSEVADAHVAIRVFFAKRVDLLFAYPWTVAPALREVPDQVVLADWYPQSPGLLSSLALSKRTIGESDQLRLLQALQAMQRDGSLARLLRKHVPEVGMQLQTRIAPLNP
jgi:hypothetical protein